MKFKTFLNHLQFYPVPNEREPWDGNKNQPKIEVDIVRFKMFTSPSIEIDNVAGSVEFLADHGSYLNFEDL
jgi:hypothetical protein